MTVKGCPDGHSNFSEEGVWAEEDMSVEEEKNGQEKRGGRQRSRERESKQVGKSGGEEIDKDKEGLGMADGSHRSQDDLDSWDKYWLPEDEEPKTELCIETR